MRLATTSITPARGRCPAARHARRGAVTRVGGADLSDAKQKIDPTHATDFILH
jgi:hypothetical protein